MTITLTLTLPSGRQELQAELLWETKANGAKAHSSGGDKVMVLKHTPW